jgi:hypothetical protein
MICQYLNNLFTIFSHYFTHSAFMKDNQILDNICKIQHIPVSIVHGRYDIPCPVDTAWLLHKVLCPDGILCNNSVAF